MLYRTECGIEANSPGMLTPEAISWDKSSKTAGLTCELSAFSVEIHISQLWCRDKREYNARLYETHPTRCNLTGRRTLVKRTPDETFALFTHERGAFIDPSLNAGVFRQDRLQRLLLHPKCGLISDPRWGHTKMVFPWAVYEAKG